MLNYEIVRSPEDFKQTSRDEFVGFLFTHLGRFRDPKAAINKSIDYAFSSEPGKGGFCIAVYDATKLVGALIMNETGMTDFIPEYILVYVAVDKQMRGEGIGSAIINRAMSLCDGDVALHVEYDNPAKRLYERLGFKSKYAEMRLAKH